MSPTSYQAAPPRINSGHSSDGPLQLSSLRRAGIARRDASGCAGFGRSLFCPLPTGMSGTSDELHPDHGRSALIRRNTGAALALAAILGIPGTFSNAQAAAIVHRFNLELGAGFTSIAADNYNQQLDYTNIFLTSRGLQGLDHITYSFMYDAGIRFFVRPSFAVRAGVSQLRNQTKREYLPAIHEDINIRSEVFSIPISVGGDYYF